MASSPDADAPAGSAPAASAAACADAERALRRDAQRNRARIVSAAQAEFAEHGLDASLEDVAARAGVGIATLYRRFPSRDDLIAASFESRVEAYAAVAQDALATPDGWSGFAMFVEAICAMQAADRGLQDVLTRTFPNARALELHRARGFALMLQVIERAQAEGSLRRDLVPEDMVLLLMGNAGVVQGAGHDAPGASPRFVGLMLDGFRIDGAHPLPEPPAPRQVMRAMHRLTPT